VSGYWVKSVGLDRRPSKPP